MNENLTVNSSSWGAKAALACYLLLIAGIFISSFAVGVVLVVLRVVDYADLSFPLALLSLPIGEAVTLIIVIFFARINRASPAQLGLKKINTKTAIAVMTIGIVLIFVAGMIANAEIALFGPDPSAEQLQLAVQPRDLTQLITLVALNLALVGPAEELAFRGFIQRGFENSFGKTAGLLSASILFALLHGLNSLYSIAPILAVALALGCMWQRTGGSTTSTALMHGVYNSVQIILLYFITV
jgi:membrane protease YdiL (CAAX protease family)